MNKVTAGQGFAQNFGQEDTLAELLLRRSDESPDLKFAIFPDGATCLADLRSRALDFARGLIGIGLKPGEKVAILMPNCIDYMIAHFGIQLAGGVGVLLTARARSLDLNHAVELSDAVFLVTTSDYDDAVNFRETLQDTYPGLATAEAGVELSLRNAPSLRHLVLFGGTSWPAAFSAVDFVARARGVSDDQLDEARRDQSREETAVMYFTSGTTSRPKACEISHAALQRSWSIFTRTVGLKAGEKVWVPMPFFHSGGIGLMAGLLADGARIASAAHFNASDVVDMIRDHRIEHLYPGFHLLAEPVLEHSRFCAEAFPFIRSMVVIGPLGTVRKLAARLPEGTPVLNLYGLSEAAGLVTLAAAEDPEEIRLTRAGGELPGIEVMIADPATGAPLPAGTNGEILFRGGGAFRAYYKAPDETAKTIRPDGFVRTGDLGNVDCDGRLEYVGRIKDMIRVGGENVAAAEIESYLSAHPGVANVQVVGKPEDRLGEVPVAFVELKPGSEATEAELVDFVRGKIARYKIPAEVRFVTEWPMSATKIQKFKLRELL